MELLLEEWLEVVLEGEGEGVVDLLDKYNLYFVKVEEGGRLRPFASVGNFAEEAPHVESIE